MYKTMDHTCKIIPADTSHVEFLASFGRQSFIEAYSCTLPMGELLSYSDTAFAQSTIRGEIEEGQAMYFLCQDVQSTLCGYSKLLPSPPPPCIESNGSIELQRLYVHDKYRTRGVGKMLAVHSENEALNCGFRNIWLRVWDGNLPARDIYAAWNYSVQGNEHYRVGAEKRTVVLMSKPLTPC